MKFCRQMLAMLVHLMIHMVIHLSLFTFTFANPSVHSHILPPTGIHDVNKLFWDLLCVHIFAMLLKTSFHSYDQYIQVYPLLWLGS